MGLVSYSDSEDSSDETAPSQADTSAKEPSEKPSFQKVVQTSDSNKIKVPLPATVRDGSIKYEAEQDAGERPAKRAKTGGAFSGFGSLLPAPKNTPPVNNGSSNGSILAQSRGTGVSKKINLKTGPAPAFSRLTSASMGVEDEQVAPATQTLLENTKPPPHATVEDDQDDVDSPGSKEPKLVGKPMMFKPLSVSRKPTKKKPPNSNPNTSMKPSNAQDVATTTLIEVKIAPQARAKEKLALFSVGVEETSAEEVIASEYQPVLVEDGDNAESPEQQNSDIIENPLETSAQNLKPPAATQDLSALANKLGLNASERRQLFGRTGEPTNAQVAQFSLAQEYKHNQELRENEETTPAHNPVKSIAPGKHSLQQLVNAAQSNKDALDESFARGRSNKKAAGSKYGW